MFIFSLNFQLFIFYEISVFKKKKKKLTIITMFEYACYMNNVCGMKFPGFE